METPRTWGLQLTGLHAVGYFLLGTLLSLVAIAVTVALGLGSVAAVTEGVFDLLELLALFLSLGVGLQRPSLFPATRSLWAGRQRGLRTGTAAAIELLGALPALVGYLGLVLFVESTYRYGGTVGEFLFGIEQTRWVNGPVALALVCAGVALYLVSTVVR